MSWFYVVLAVLCAGSNALPQTFELTEKQTKELTQFVSDVMGCTNIPGLAIAVTTANASLWEQGFGHEKLDPERVLVSPDTRFGIASLSKAFTSALLAILMGKGTKHGDKR